MWLALGLCALASGMHVLVRVLLFAFGAQPLQGRARACVCEQSVIACTFSFLPVKHNKSMRKYKARKDAVLSTFSRAAHKEPPSLSQQRSLHQGVGAGEGVRSLPSVGKRVPVCAVLLEEAHNL